MKKSLFDDRDRTAEVAGFVTWLNVERFLEHQMAALNSQIKFLEEAETRLAAARARKQSVMDTLALAVARREVAAKDVPASILRTLVGANDELGADSISSTDLATVPVEEVPT